MKYRMSAPYHCFYYWVCNVPRIMALFKVENMGKVEKVESLQKENFSGKEMPSWHHWLESEI